MAKDSGVTKKIIKKGDGWKTPEKVVVCFTCGDFLCSILY